MEGDVFHRTDGRGIPIPEDLFWVLELDDGFMASNYDEVAFLDSAGVVTASRPGAGPVLSPTGFLVAYYNEEDSIVWAGQADGGGTWPGTRDVPSDQRVEPVGFLDEWHMVSNLSTAEGHDTGLRVDDFGPAADPVPVTPPWDLERVTAASAVAGLVVGYSEMRDDGTCSAVYEADSAEPLWETCEYSFDQFSPDGRYIVGTHHYRDGEGNTFAVVVDARTGEVVHTYEGRFINEYAFEGDDHLLISVRLIDGDERQAALVRCDLSGSCELTTPLVRVDQMSGAYRLGLQRW